MEACRKHPYVFYWKLKSTPFRLPAIMEFFPMQIEKVYEPQRFEPHWAQWWIDSGIFQAASGASSGSTGGRVFSLVIPPPNVTGSLHIGHMLEHTEIDVTVRWHRMLGHNRSEEHTSE